jgi:prepilin-type N-terminal cleavage/methylation domain-containing protein/prepilin-type processing-associated H-X9-DG protein
MKSHSSRSTGQGFTLLELLVTVAIVSILITMLVPGIAGLRERALSSQCIGNLRQVGAGAMLSASENDGKWLFFDRDQGWAMWDKLLLDQGYLSSSKVTYCPAWKPKTYKTWRTYGVTWLGLANKPDDDGVIIANSDGNGRVTGEINFMAISKPSSFLLMADSYTTRASYDKSQYAIVQGGGWSDEIHLRHAARANILFGDGHVSALAGTDLPEIGWEVAFDRDGKLINF